MDMKCWLSLEQQQKLSVFANIGFVKLATGLALWKSSGLLPKSKDVYMSSN